MAQGIRGLAALKNLQKEQEERAAAASRPKANWFKWPDKQTNVVVVRFLQELDQEADNYDPNRGLGAAVVEHNSPNEDFRKQRRASCSLDDEGNCYACERHAADRKAGWGQRNKLYINALYQFGDGPVESGVINRNFNSSFVQALMDEAIDENTITDSNYRITRTGDGPTTAWTLKRLNKDRSTPLDDKDAKVYDLEQTVLINVPYSKQAEYYGSAEAKAVKEEEKESAALQSVSKSFEDESW